MQCLNKTAMIDSLNKELKALEEMTDNLRTLFQHEDRLIAEGWFSKLEFLYAVYDVIQESIEHMKEE